MKRLLIFLATAVAAAAVAVPAFAGLAGNPSFSHKLPVHVPSQAQLVHFDDDGRAVHTTRSSMSGDDHRGSGRPRRTSEPGDDRGHGGASSSGSGDDSGGSGSGSGRGR